MEATQARKAEEHNARAALAFNIAAFIKRPRLRAADLRQLLVPKRRRLRRQTWQEMLEVAKAITWANRGKVG